MKIYLAAPWSEKDHLALEAKTMLENASFEVVSSWITREPPLEGEEASPEILKEEAAEDLSDLCSSDLFILLNTQKRGEETSGKQVEFGVALALGLPIIVVGEPSNIFHHLNAVLKVDSIDEAVYRIVEAMMEEASNAKPDVQ